MGAAHYPPAWPAAQRARAGRALECAGASLMSAFSWPCEAFALGAPGPVRFQDVSQPGADPDGVCRYERDALLVGWPAFLEADALARVWSSRLCARLEAGPAVPLLDALDDALGWWALTEDLVLRHYARLRARGVDAAELAAFRAGGWRECPALLDCGVSRFYRRCRRGRDARGALERLRAGTFDAFVYDRLGRPVPGLVGAGGAPSGARGADPDRAPQGDDRRAAHAAWSGLFRALAWGSEGPVLRDPGVVDAVPPRVAAIEAAFARVEAA